MHEMSTPTRPIPRKFYRVAYQRFEEAEVLFEVGYYIGAVYLEPGESAPFDVEFHEPTRSYL